ncbi:MAG: hypothetical protein E7279_09295 [Lachnospiraceae bacterium]|nr:hypothetical protein [Lachnospiraceae bacterium]
MSKWKSFIIATRDDKENIADIVEYDVPDKTFEKINKIVDKGKDINSTVIVSEKLKSIAKDTFEKMCAKHGINGTKYDVEVCVAFDPFEHSRFINQFIGEEMTESLIDGSGEYTFEVIDDDCFEGQLKYVIKVSYSQDGIIMNLEITSMEVIGAVTISGENCTYFYPVYGGELGDAIYNELEW